MAVRDLRLRAGLSTSLQTISTRLAERTNSFCVAMGAEGARVSFEALQGPVALSPLAPAAWPQLPPQPRRDPGAPQSTLPKRLGRTVASARWAGLLAMAGSYPTCPPEHLAGGCRAMLDRIAPERSWLRPGARRRSVPPTTQFQLGFELP